MSDTINAAKLIAQAEAYGKEASPGDSDFAARMRLAATVGVMRADIEMLCTLVEALSAQVASARAIAMARLS